MSDSPYVSRAGRKLEHGLEAFGLDVTGLRCADFGCNVGGFTDCLLQRGAAHVIAVDTGYGTLAWPLRNDERVTVRERTNALHASPPEPLVDLVTIDLAWTRQQHALPAAPRWVHERGRLVTLVKPHYELEPDERRAWLRRGTLEPARAREVLYRVVAAFHRHGVEPIAVTPSPLTGRKTRRAAGPGVVGPGNVEYLVLARPRPSGTAA